MKRNILKTATASLLLIILFISCKKDAKKSKTELLTQKAWIQQKDEEKINNGDYVDSFPGWDDCDKDDIIRFLTNSTFSLEEGATKCDVSDPQVIDTGAWAFTQNETVLSVDGIEYTIDKLDDNTLIVSNSESSGGDTYYYRYTFGH